MGWVKRGGQAYYYVGQRDENRVQQVYVGNSAAASLAAVVTEIRRRERLERRMAPPTPPNADDELREEVALLAGELRAEVHAAMHAAGYHRHDRGPWRLRYRSAGALPHPRGGVRRLAPRGSAGACRDRG